VRAALSRGLQPPAEIDGAEELARRATVAHARIEGGRLIFDPSPVKAGDANTRSPQRQPGDDNPEVTA
jgi:hypothetical protein